MAPVELTARNATVFRSNPGAVASDRTEGRTAAQTTAAMIAAPEPTAPAVPTMRQHDPKSAGLGVLFSFLITGGGQFYAGDSGKGWTLLGLNILAAGGTVALANRRECTYGSCNETPQIALAVTSLTLVIYSMASAPGDVRGWNRTHNAVAAAPRVLPMVVRHGRGTEFGIAAAW